MPTIAGPTGCRLLATTQAGTEHDIAKMQERLIGKTDKQAAMQAAIDALEQALGTPNIARELQLGLCWRALDILHGRIPTLSTGTPMSARPPFNVHYNHTPAMCVPVNGLFEWQNTLYLVLASTTLADDEDDWVSVQQLASVWTDNPYPRWQFGNYEPSRFRADCVVHELIPLPPQQQPDPNNQGQQPTNSELRA